MNLLNLSCHHNLCEDIPDALPDEFFQTLATGRDCRIERIVSHGHRSPDGFWYDQSQDEFILLVQGAARLELELAAPTKIAVAHGFAVDGPNRRIISLRPGDHVVIPAGCRHRVDWTTPDANTVWLAVHFTAIPPAPSAPLIRPVPTVLFLCTGNFYRSRFAEILFNHRAAERGLAWRAESRGLALTSTNVGAMSHLTVERLHALGISVAGYERLPLPTLDSDFEQARQVIAVKEAEHRVLIEQQFPAWLDRVEFWGVHDIDCAGPEQALPELEALVLRLLDKLAKQCR